MRALMIRPRVLRRLPRKPYSSFILSAQKETRVRCPVRLVSRRVTEGGSGQRLSSLTTIPYTGPSCAIRTGVGNAFSATIGSSLSPYTMSTGGYSMLTTNRFLTAKNLALAAIKSVALHDMENVEVWDLSGNFFLSEDDIGRAASCVEKLQLNNAVLTSALKEELTTEHLSKFQFYFNSLESLPTYALDPKDLKPLHSRYDAQISDFDSKLQKMQDTSIFVVGSGALGCEFLKNFASMGVSCGRKGKLTITDDCVIEKSNLSRQFLFHDWNIGQTKSTVAATAASTINSSLHIDALQNRACPETEHVFNDAFWEGLDAVINALDNINARLYMDMGCLYFQKPLLESGTLGPKCNTQMVIPHLTENYGASRDLPEKQAPKCTVHSFPPNIDHGLTWACSEFEGLLVLTPNEVDSFISNPAEYAAAMRKASHAQARELLQRVCEWLDKERCDKFEDCIAWARLKFEDYFSNRVKQLTFTFPEDAATSTGAPLWPALCPVQFSAVDSSHIQFILASMLRVVSFRILIPDWLKNMGNLADIVSKVAVPEFEPKSRVKIETDEKATNLSSASVDDAAVIEDLLTKLEACAKKLPSGYEMQPIQFQKDDDTNFHMDLIAGLANMRARNYDIQEVDKLKVKFIAGRIIPAIATTTGGLVCLELYKVLAGDHAVEDYCNTFASVALPMFSIAEPVLPKVVKHQEMQWTVWDRWSIKGNITVARNN